MSEFARRYVVIASFTEKEPSPILLYSGSSILPAKLRAVVIAEPVMILCNAQNKRRKARRSSLGKPAEDLGTGKNSRAGVQEAQPSSKLPLSRQETKESGVS